MFWPIKRRRHHANPNEPLRRGTALPRERMLSMPPQGFTNLEVGVLVDATGSGATFSHGVPLAARVILTEVERRVGQLSVFVQTHGDEDYGERPQVVCHGADARAASAAVAAIRYEGGGDAKETHLSAIESALRRFGERPLHAAGRRVMLAFVNDETKPARSGRTPKQVGLAARELGLLVYLVCEPTRSLRAFCDSAGGLVVPISNNPTEEMMLSLARRIAGSVAYSVSMRSLTPMEAPTSFNGR